MKTYFCLLLVPSLSASIFAQNIKVGDGVEINQNMSRYLQAPWVKGTVTQFDKVGKLYTVKLTNGHEIGIISETPETFNRVAQSTLPAPTKPPTPVPPVPQKEEKVSQNSTNCALTEKNIKQPIKDEIDSKFSEVEKRTITYTLFEKGKAYRNTDPYRGQVNTLIHPFRVTFTVDLVGGQDNMTTKKHKYDKKYVIYLDTKDQCEFGHEEIYQSERIYN